MAKNGFDKRPEDTKKGGRRQGSLNWSTRIKMMLEADDAVTWIAIIKSMSDKALEGDVRAAEFLANRMEGHPIATIQTQEIPPIEIKDYGGDSYIQKTPEE